MVLVFIRGTSNEYASNEYHNISFHGKMWKYPYFFIEKKKYFI